MVHLKQNILRERQARSTWKLLSWIFTMIHTLKGPNMGNRPTKICWQYLFSRYRVPQMLSSIILSCLRSALTQLLMGSLLRMACNALSKSSSNTFAMIDECSRLRDSLTYHNLRWRIITLRASKGKLKCMAVPVLGLLINVLTYIRRNMFGGHFPSSKKKMFG